MKRKRIVLIEQIVLMKETAYYDEVVKGKIYGAPEAASVKKRVVLLTIIRNTGPANPNSVKLLVGLDSFFDKTFKNEPSLYTIDIEIA